jgi:sulfonate transport system substrate-binding protein
MDRRKFLGAAAATAGGLLVGDLAIQQEARAQAAGRFTDWGWPQPYEQISAKSKQWLESKGWWPLAAGWIVVWSGEEMIGNILQSEKLLEKRGLDVKWQTFVAAGFSNEAFIPGRIQLANTGALGVLALLANKVPHVRSPCTRPASRMRQRCRSIRR